jgi:hypothetical protein
MQPKAVAFQVFDQSIMDQSAVAPNINDFRSVLELGMIRQSNDWRSLGASVGIDGSALEATVSKYNADVKAGLDSEHGRQTLGGGFGKPVPLEYVLPGGTARRAEVVLQTLEQPLEEALVGSPTPAGVPTLQPQPEPTVARRPATSDEAAALRDEIRRLETRLQTLERRLTDR